MKLELDIIAGLTKDLGFSSRFGNLNELEIEMSPGIIFIFKNIENEDDNAFGFQDTPWHSHDKLSLMVGDDSYIELNDIEIIVGIKEGNVLLCEQYVNGILTDRWLRHKNEKDDNKYIEAGEEIRIRRYPFYC